MNHKLNVALAGLALLAAAGSASAQEVVKIGHVGPTSGGIAHLGKDNENGARMAIDELNAKGVTIGGKKVKFELLAEDDGGDPKQGTAAAQKLVDSKVAGVVGHLNSGTSIPARRSTATRAFRRCRRRRRTRSTPARASRRPSVWWRTMFTWAARWASTR